MKIYPSLISSDLLNIEETLTELDKHCEGYHIDVMDDHFVPNLTWGPMFINAIAGKTKLPLQVHLMVDNPDKWIDRLNLTTKDSFIFHMEAVNNNQAKAIIAQLKSKNIKIGIAINPKTPVLSIEHLLCDLDEVLVMSVVPGYSGQKFIDVTDKVTELIRLRSEQNSSFEICMDGGIGKLNIAMLAEKGVDLVGVASAIFFQGDMVASLKDLYAFAKK